MSHNIFLKLEGGLPEGKLDGEFQAESHEKEIVLLEWQWGVENNINIGSITTGGGAGKASFNSLSLTKRVDSASAGLMEALVTGRHIDSAKLTIGQPGEGKPKILEIELRLVMVSAIEAGSAEGDDWPIEYLTLEFGAFKMNYFKVDDKGNAKKHSDVSWSRIKNKASLEI